VTVSVVDLQDLLHQQVTVSGWVHTVRNQKRMQFVVLRDATGMVQVVHERQGEGDSLEEMILQLTPDSTVRISGTVVPNPVVKLGQLEIVASQVEVFSLAESPLPITPQTNLDQRLDWRFIDLRQPRNRLIFEIQSTAEHAMREFWRQEGFLEIHSPKLMGGASESGAELFRVDYFGGNAYLAQSPQFYKQMAMAAGFDRIFEIGPVFRANPSFTSRHDTEFTSVDVEMSWIDSHEDVMAFEERWIQYFFQAIADRHGSAIHDLFETAVTVPTVPFPRLTMAEAGEIVRQHGYTIPPDTKGDLDPHAERLVAGHIKQTQGHDFVFVTEYPTSVRAFYHMREDDRPTTTKSFDLLFRGLEVTTGAQREHRYDRLVRQAEEKGLSPDELKYYLDFFRYGCPPHGGYGFGLTRILMQLLGLQNVREVTYLYRGPNRLTP
jgi:aspartyl-tRNA synthetase